MKSLIMLFQVKCFFEYKVTGFPPQSKRKLLTILPRLFPTKSVQLYEAFNVTLCHFNREVLSRTNITPTQCDYIQHIL